ncbi:MAG: ArsA family ATPase [Chloroflexi bacterium]|nr:ArsA family ATPase [Chloroflexota bacterium]
MRILLFTGKGGVGKTSVAAATALRSAELGYSTIILSTDPAHSLADSFDQPLSAKPVPIVPNLWGQEVDVLHEIEAHWGAVKDYMAAVLAWRGLDDVLAEEMAVLPGMDEVASLLYITTYHDHEDYDVIIVDCAPTGETLRLLAFPDLARWWVEKILPLERKASKLLRPIMRPILNVPIPDDGVFDTFQALFKKLDRMHSLLSEPQKSSVRLVLNPEKMVIKEAQRTLTYLNLYGYYTDAIVCNRLIPDHVQDPYFDSWKESQNKYLQMIEECFAPLPILRVPLFDQEVVGVPMLKLLAEHLYGSEDPTKVYSQGTIHTVEREDGAYLLTFTLPFIEKGDIQITRSGDELIVRVGSQRRNIILPRALASLETKEARFNEDLLKIKFGKSS